MRHTAADFVSSNTNRRCHNNSFLRRKGRRFCHHRCYSNNSCVEERIRRYRTMAIIERCSETALSARRRRMYHLYRLALRVHRFFRGRFSSAVCLQISMKVTTWSPGAFSRCFFRLVDACSWNVMFCLHAPHTGSSSVVDLSYSLCSFFELFLFIFF